MTVKITGMEMPKSCLDCRFAYVSHTTFSGDILMCPYLGRGVSSKERESSCPLQEVNNELPQNSACFDCAHTTTCLWLKKHGPCYSCGSKKVKECEYGY